MTGQIRHFLLALGLLTGFSAGAFEPAPGQFLVRQDCPATTGIHRPPDDVRLRQGDRYQAVGLNRQHGDFLQIRMPDSKPELRWVRLTCGELQTAASSATAATTKPPGFSAHRNARQFLLALSWQPAFCESQPDKPECRTQTASRYDADHFSLHGLWPQSQGLGYCDVSPLDRASDERRRWDLLPRLHLQPETIRRLHQVMPGTASGLERHEWVRHGSCSGHDPERYYRTALFLLEQINQSRLREALAGRLGETVTARQLKAAFAASFGQGADQALGVGCRRDGQRQLISEIRIKLKPPLNENTPLREALDVSSPAFGNCEAGVVDRAGLAGPGR